MSKTFQASNLKVYRRPAVQQATGLPKSTLYALMAAGKFPKPIRIGVKSVGWLEAEIEAWIASRIAERAQGDA